MIRNWIRSRNTIEFLGIWEQLNNDGFNVIEFDDIKKEAGLNSFTLTPKQWIESTGAIGLISKAGRYGGTYAQKDIGFEFASWILVEFKRYLIKAYRHRNAFFSFLFLYFLFVAVCVFIGRGSMKMVWHVAVICLVQSSVLLYY